MNTGRKIKILLETRPALDGFAGIPQETRLLFRALCMSDMIELEGLLQTSFRFLAEGMKSRRSQGIEVAESVRLHRYSRVVISIDTKPNLRMLNQAVQYLKGRRAAYALTLSTILPGKRKVKTSVFESRYFENFIWQSLFAKTLDDSDFKLVTEKNYRVCAVPWNILQFAGLNWLRFASKPVFPELDTEGTDIFIAQTPYPARLTRSTALVVRYHDALPVFMPHAFANKARHHATHFHALSSNVRSGAYFACVSDSTRKDLLRIFPEAAERTVTIHNMVSHHFYDENSFLDRVPGIVRSRLNFQAPEAHPKFSSLREQERFYKCHLSGRPFKYLLMVSTIEPRKNHSRLIAAWEVIRAEVDPSLKLIVVGGLGWDVGPIMKEMRSWIDRGALFVLNDVPASDLRVLYRHAAATICPSLAEGFNFSGVECMRSGGIAIASDIAVHREIYDGAAEYFEVHSSGSLVSAIKKVIYAPDAARVREEMRTLGQAVSSRYSAEQILPQWEAFLEHVAQREKIPSQLSIGRQTQGVGAI